MRKEIWKPIKNYENLYDASNWGRIRSLDRWIDRGTGGYIQKGRILKLIKNEDGYLRVCLCKDGKEKRFYVHRLVWEAFNGSIPDGYEINHIDENPLNNRLNNINLLTHGQNINWGTRTQKAKEKLTNGKLSQAVLQLTYPELQFMCEWPSAMEAGRNGFDQGNVSACCRGERKSHKGVTFRYKETLTLL